MPIGGVRKLTPTHRATHAPDFVTYVVTDRRCGDPPKKKENHTKSGVGRETLLMSSLTPDPISPERHRGAYYDALSVVRASNDLLH